MGRGDQDEIGDRVEVAAVLATESAAEDVLERLEAYLKANPPFEASRLDPAHIDMALAPYRLAPHTIARFFLIYERGDSAQLLSPSEKWVTRVDAESSDDLEALLADIAAMSGDERSLLALLDTEASGALTPLPLLVEAQVPSRAGQPGHDERPWQEYHQEISAVLARLAPHIGDDPQYGALFGNNESNVYLQGSSLKRSAIQAEVTTKLGIRYLTLTYPGGTPGLSVGYGLFSRIAEVEQALRDSVLNAGMPINVIMDADPGTTNATLGFSVEVSLRWGSETLRASRVVTA